MTEKPQGLNKTSSSSLNGESQPIKGKNGSLGITKKMKILLITDNHTLSGGAENYFFELKERLKNRPEIEVYSIGFGPSQKTGPDYFVLKSTKSNFAKMLWRLLFHPFVYLKLRKKIREVNPDVIHIHNIKQYTTSLLKAIKSYPVVQTVHDYSSVCPIAQNIHKNGQICITGLRISCFWQHQVKYNRIIYLFLALAFLRTRKKLKQTVKHFLAPSPLLVSYLDKNYFRETHYIPPFKNEKKPIVFAPIKPFQFLFAGNIGTHKGVYLLVEEFALACRKNSNLSLMMAGTGPEKESLQKRIIALGIEKNVVFLNWQQDLDRYYAECIALIFPSTGMESFGMVITEAMNHARPVIGINRGTSAWLIDDNETGLLFDPLKQGDLAKKLLLLAGNLDLAQTLGQNGYEKLHQLIDNEETLNKILGIYKSCLSHR